MKKNYLFMLFIATAIFLTSCGPTKDDAIAWNNSIIDYENQVDGALDTFFDNFNVEGTDLNKECDKVIAIQEDCMKKIKALEDFKDGAEFKAAGIETIALYESILKNEIKQIIALRSNPDATDEDFAKVKEHLANSEKKLNEADAKFGDAQKAFAQKWGFELVAK